MEVTHIERLDPHAIIGGSGKAELFSMAQSAEMYQMLTSTLYSNEKVAFVREVMCNAWDAHIDAGKTDVPVEITIDANEVIFKDRGKGIPKRRMAQVYGTYGESTKTKDEKQTGGFGLGSKSPLAFTTNFSVTTEHAGSKTAFNISRGTEESHGIPIMQEILTVDTTETGLTVSVPLNSPKEQKELIKIIQNVAKFGNILCTLNGSQIERLPYSLAEKDKTPFIAVIASEIPDYLGQSGTDQYFVKVGGVVYPVSEEMCKKYLTRTKFHKAMAHYAFRYVLIAKPSSMGIVPSREALKYTEHTITALKDLAKELDAWLDRHRDYAVNIIADATTKHIQASMRTEPDSLYGYLHQQGTPYTELVSQYMTSYWGRHNYTVSFTGNTTGREFLATNLVANRAEREAVAEILTKRDPEQNMIRKLARKILKDTYGGILREFHKAKARKENSYSRDKYHTVYFSNYLDNILSKKVFDYFEFVQKNVDGEVFICNEKLSNYINHKSSAGVTVDELKLSLRRDSHTRAALAKIFMTQRRVPFNTSIIVTPSEAAYKRLVRKNLVDQKKYGTAIKVIVKDKKKYENTIKFFFDRKVSYILDVAALDVKPKPVMITDRLWVMNWDIEQELPRVMPRHFENVKHYIFMPRPSMIPDLPYGHPRDAKLLLDTDILRALCHCYPNLVVAPTTADAAEMEKNGLKNVMEVLAEEVEEFLKEDSTFEKYLPFINQLTRHSTHGGVATILGVLEPRQLMETFGLPVNYTIKPIGVLPTIVEIYLSILGKSYAAKYGIQHLHRVASQFTERFNTFFGPYSDVLYLPEVDNFVRCFPNFRYTRPNNKLMFQTALMSVIQHLMVQTKLSQMEKPNG